MAVFSARHYNLVSDTISNLNLPEQTKIHVALKFIDLFKKDNKIFSPIKFYLSIFARVEENPQQKGGE